MTGKVPRSAASVAAALMLFLPPPAHAARLPERLGEPLIEVWESDPWRPDVYPPPAAWQVNTTVSADEDALTARQPANRSEWWVRLLRRFFAAVLTGGLR